MKKKCGCALVAALCVLSAALAAPASAQSGNLPIDAFAMEPAIENVRVSPDGKHLAMLMLPHKGAKPHLVIYETADLNKDPVRLASERMRYNRFFWANSDRLVVQMIQRVDVKRAELALQHFWLARIWSVGADGKDWLELPERPRLSRDRMESPFDQLMRAYGPTFLVSELPSDDDHIIIGYRVEGNKWAPDYYKIDVKTGAMMRIMPHNPRLGGFMVERDGTFRFADSFDPGTWENIFYMRDSNDQDWQEIYRYNIQSKEIFEILGDFTEDPNTILVLANNGRDKAAVWELDRRSRKMTKVVYEHPEVDVLGVVRSSKEGEEDVLAGFITAADRVRVHWVQEGEKRLHRRIDEALPGTYNQIVSRSDDDKYMVVYAEGPREPGAFYLFVGGRELRFLGRKFPFQTPDKLGKLEFIKYKARDGLEIPAYMWTPPTGKPPYPAVVLPHGGPWARDFPLYGAFPWPQFLAHHGYLVLQPQYRGSLGFGARLWRSGDAQWGLTMQDDLEDGMTYLVKKGLVDKNRMAIFGWSYGGYASFVAATRANGLFQCAIPGAGVSDLKDIQAGVDTSRILRRIQRPTIKGISPLEHVKNVNIPMLIIHGDADETVEIEHSEKFVSGLKRYNKPYKFVRLEGMDHGSRFFYEEQKQFYTALLNFLKNDCGPGGL